MNEASLKDPWLVAVWPGMGGVARIAGGYLVDRLRGTEVARVAGDGFFEVRAVRVVGGLARTPRLPRGRFFAWRDPGGRRDLLIFVGDQQPDLNGYAYCEAIVESAVRLGAVRIFTFAAMASSVQPQAAPRVQIAATTPALLAALRERGADALVDGEIAGLNGVLLAAAAARGVEAACLLGEMPFFAGQVPNPKASRAILELFAQIAGIELDLSGLDEHVAAVEAQLVRHLQQLQRATEVMAEGAAELAESAEDGPARIPLDVEARIEEMFEIARGDRERAAELKDLLDRHGVFARYEDRFLDLFRRPS